MLENLKIFTFLYALNIQVYLDNVIFWHLLSAILLKRTQTKLIAPVRNGLSSVYIYIYKVFCRAVYLRVKCKGYVSPQGLLCLLTFLLAFDVLEEYATSCMDISLTHTLYVLRLPGISSTITDCAQSNYKKKIKMKNFVTFFRATAYSFCRGAL